MLERGRDGGQLRAVEAIYPSVTDTGTEGAAIEVVAELVNGAKLTRVSMALGKADTGRLVVQVPKEALGQEAEIAFILEEAADRINRLK